MERNQNPIWYKLTKFLKKQEKITTGLTIPYLFGAYKWFDKDLSNISDLLDELRKYPIDKYPVIQKCNVIHQHVIAVEHKYIYNKKSSNDLKLQNKYGDVDLIISSNTNLGKTDSEIYKNLTYLYEEFVKKGTFSWDNNTKEWKVFSKNEIELLNAIRKE
jgi:hypothetical protein